MTNCPHQMDQISTHRY